MIGYQFSGYVHSNKHTRSKLPAKSEQDPKITDFYENLCTAKGFFAHNNFPRLWDLLTKDCKKTLAAASYKKYTDVQKIITHASFEFRNEIHRKSRKKISTK